MLSNTMPKDHKIVIIAKDAVEGRVKTRLSPCLSPQKARDIYRELALHICSRVVETKIPVEISFQGDMNSEFAKELQAMGCILFQQPIAPLGDIIFHALHRADRVMALGMDSPLVSPTEIIQVMQQQETVFGPAEDGGYWMIAANKPPQCIFQNISWSTNLVLEQSIARCKEADIVYSLAQTHYDIDTPQDLNRLLNDPLLPHSLRTRIQQYA